MKYSDIAGSGRLVLPALLLVLSAAGAQAEPASVSVQLGEALAGQGWSRVEAADGSVYYLPPGPPAPGPRTDASAPDADAASAAAEPSAADVQVQAAETAQVDSPAAGGLAARFQDALDAHGWVRFEAADGSVIYRKTPASTGDAPAHSEPTLADDLRSQLETLGWVGAVAKDGSMVYWPPDQSAAGSVPATAANAEVSRPAGARTRGVPRAAIAPPGCCPGWGQWSRPAPPAWQAPPWAIPPGRFWQR